MRVIVSLLLAIGLLSCSAEDGRKTGQDRRNAADGGSHPLLGRIQTLAGPGFCYGPSAVDPASKSVGSLAIGEKGTFFFEAGRPREGLIGRVSAEGASTTLETDIPRAAGFSRPGSSATAGPGGLASDGTGGIFLAAGAKVLQFNERNELVGRFGDPNSTAGRPGEASLGDGGPASGASFRNAKSLVADSNQNLYIADQVHSKSGLVKIRFINRGSDPITFFGNTPHEKIIDPGHIDTIAGAEDGQNGGDGGPAVRASIRGVPPSLAVASGRLYLGLGAVAGGVGPKTSTVRMINLSGEAKVAHGLAVGGGEIRTVAGSANEGSGGDGGSAVRGRFSSLPGLAADESGNLYFADYNNHRVRMVDPSGRLTTVAGAGPSGPSQGGFNGNDRPARHALLHHPYDVKLAPGGLYISDQGNNQVRVVDGSGTIRAAPGGGVATRTECLQSRSSSSPKSPERDQRPDVPREQSPFDVDADPDGNVFFAIREMNQIKKLHTSGRVTTVAGAIRPVDCPEQCPTFEGDGKAAEKALLNSPGSVALDPQAGLYFSDSGNGRVRFVNLGRKQRSVHGVNVSPGKIQTVAGNGKEGKGQTTDIGSGRVIREPGALAVGKKGTLFIAESGRILELDSSGTLSTTAGQGAPPGLSGCCRDPVDLAVDNAGNLYVGDQDRAAGGFRTPHPKVWYVNRGLTPLTVRGQNVPPGEAKVIAGNGEVGFSGDGGPAVDSHLLVVEGIALDKHGNLFIAGVTEPTQAGSTGTGDIRKVDASGTITSVAGNGIFGFNGDGLKGPLTSVFPTDVGMDPCGNPLIADRGRVRRLTLTAECNLDRRGIGGLERP